MPSVMGHFDQAHQLEFSGAGSLFSGPRGVPVQLCTLRQVGNFRKTEV